MNLEQNKLVEEIKEFMEDCSYETAAGEAYGHPQYITGFPLFLEDVLHYLIPDVRQKNRDNWMEGRYLILKYKREIDSNFQKILNDANLSKKLFEGIKDLENFQDFM